MNALNLQPGLRDERIALRQELAEAEALIADYKRQELRRTALVKVRDAIWAMKGTDGVEGVLKKAGEVLQELDIPFAACGINWVDAESDPPTVWFRSLDAANQGLGSQIQADNPGVALILRFWREQKIVYRPDLEAIDPYGECERIRVNRPICSVLDVPFSHGTLAVSSLRPRAFSSEDILFLEEMARLLSEFAQRRDDFAALEERNWELETEIAERKRIESDLEQSRNALEVRVGERTKALVASESRYRQLVESISSGVYVLDSQWRFALVNDAGARFLGQSLDQLHQAKLYEGFPRIGESKFLAVFRRVMRERRPATVTDEYSFEDGRHGWCEVHVHPVEEGILCIAVDTTDRIELEAQLRQAQKMEAVGRLTAGIAHNFNNLLQGTLGNLFLAANTAPAAIKPLLDDATAPMHRAAEMIRQLMHFARAGKTPDHGPIDLTTVLEQVAAICQRTFDQKIEFELQVADHLPAVLGDANQLQQVLLNLLLNARDAVVGSSAEHWRISLCAERVDYMPQSESPEMPAGTYLHLRVSDNGVGMSEKTRQQIFEPFFTTKAVGTGTGLGLATAYAIVDQHRGWMHCQSHANRGSTFSIHLPVTAIAPKTTNHNGHTPPSSKGETILIVDDDKTVRHSTRQALSLFGYQILEAEDGPTALETLRHIGSTVDLVLLDLSMPKMSGGEVLEKIRVENPALKVVIFTGYGHHKGDFTHAEGVIHKPFTPKQIHHQVRQVLDYQSRR